MKVSIVEFEPWHLLALEPRAEQKALFSGFESLEDFRVYGNSLLDFAVYTDRGERVAYTAITDDCTVLISGGILRTSPCAGEAWLAVSSDFYKMPLAPTRKIRRMLNDTSLRRISAKASFEDAAKYLEFLGFTFEAILEAGGPVGEDTMLYKIINRSQ